MNAPNDFTCLILPLNIWPIWILSMFEDRFRDFLQYDDEEDDEYDHFHFQSLHSGDFDFSFSSKSRSSSISLFNVVIEGFDIP